jgi:hypothetical protein
MNKSKAKGTAAETAVTRYLDTELVAAVRNPPQGSNDKGDIKLLDLPVIIEVKNCVKLELSEWVKEAIAERENAGAQVGVVWHKKKGTQDPGQWYVSMSGKDFVELLHMERP